MEKVEISGSSSMKKKRNWSNSKIAKTRYADIENQKYNKNSIEFVTYEMPTNPREIYTNANTVRDITNPKFKFEVMKEHHDIGKEIQNIFIKKFYLIFNLNELKI